MSDDPSNRAAYDRFVAALERAAVEGRLEQVVLTGPRGAQPDLRRLTARPVVLRGRPHLNFVYAHERRDVTKNLPLDDGLQVLRGQVDAGFTNAHLHLAGEEWQLARSRKGRFSLRVARVEAAVPAAPVAPHNREKRHLVELDRPFLAELGVTDAAHRLVPAMARKWRQINKFVEIMAGALADSPLAGRREFEVLDFGAGRGTLTFALHDHLRHALGLNARVTGIEVREALVLAGNAIVGRLGLEGLSFETGDIASFAPRPVDVMIALHACDTLTDHAIHYAIRGGASVICCAPCCHKQVRAQLRVPQPLRPLLQHGVHLGQEAEMLTDALRALLLQACGYEARVFEFVSLEHTAKNKMILAVRRDGAAAATRALDDAHELEAFYGLREQCLQSLLEADGRLPRSAAVA